jgi:hypothetical protein
VSATSGPLYPASIAVVSPLAGMCEESRAKSDLLEMTDNEPSTDVARATSAEMAGSKLGVGDRQ